MRDRQPKLVSPTGPPEIKTIVLWAGVAAVGLLGIAASLQSEGTTWLVVPMAIVTLVGAFRVWNLRNLRKIYFENNDEEGK